MIVHALLSVVRGAVTHRLLITAEAPAARVFARLDRPRVFEVPHGVEWLVYALTEQELVLALAALESALARASAEVEALPGAQRGLAYALGLDAPSARGLAILAGMGDVARVGGA